MGSFWGLDNAGKEAQGWPREWGAWSSGQAKNSWIPRSDNATSAGQSASDWYKNYNENRANNGIGSIGDMQAYGSMIMPGVNQYITDKSGRIQGQIDAFNNLPGWQDTMSKVQAANDASRANANQELSYIDQNRNYALNDIGDTYNRSVGNEDTAYDANTKDLTDRYNGLIDKANSDYGTLRQENKDTYGQLSNQSDAAYKTAMDNTELLRPGSQFQVAQTARSFAPQMASTAGSLRRMGIDPNSPQGLSMMQRVTTDRSRAMDDKAGQGTVQYVGAKNDLITGQQADREKLGQGQLGNEMNLGTAQNAETTGLSTDQGTGLRNENTRHAGTLTGLDQTRFGASIATQNNAMDRITQNDATMRGINSQDAQNAVMGKAMATQDWQTRGDLQGQLSDAELEAIGLNQQMYNAGLGYKTADLNERNAGAAGVGQYGQNMLNYGLQSSQLANQWGNTAMDAYKTAYGYEAPQAGYGAKMLAAAGGAALDLVAPGAGTALTGAYNSPLPRKLPARAAELAATAATAA
jgi:hypothetical protein